MNYILPKENLLEFLNSLKKKFEVVAPVMEQDGSTLFKEFNVGELLFLEENTRFPPKRFFLPEKDSLFLFKNGKIVETIDKRKRVIFGLRSCDLHALEALDRLFIHYYSADPYYSARRRNTLLIGLLCNYPGKNCFCESMGTSQPVGYDLLFTEQGKNYYVEVGSSKGAKLINKLFKKAKGKKKKIKIKCEKKLDTKGLPLLLENNFKHPVWKKEAARCLSCAACTLVCPTCYCFVIKDEFDFGSGNSAKRSRVWDSCQLKQFTTVAGGTIFRESRTARLRQFVNHNLLYYKKNFATFKCIGCGRCINECPVDIDLTHICNTIRGKK